jgi:Na+/H+-dicarboxylate symporter
MGKRLTLFILIGLIAGVVVGYVLNTGIDDAAQRQQVASYFSVIADMFLRLIRMIIAPLVFSTLVVGIAHLGDTAAIGRIGVRTIGWFIVAGLLSLLLGMAAGAVLQPGASLELAVPAADATSEVQTSALGIREFVTHLVPRSIVEAMATNEILQIVVFSVFFGVGIGAIGKRAHALVEVIDQVAHVMLRVTGYVMLAAPVAVFAAIAAVVTTRGLDIIVTYGKFVGGFYVALVVLWAVLLGLGAIFIGGGRVRELVTMIREPVLLAFSTASSEAAYPKTLEQLERFGVSKRIASFVLPLGYSFNLDGSMMYQSFALLFIAQAYGIELTVMQQIVMLLLLMVTSKGIAGVPRASLVVLAATIGQLGLPEGGVLLVLAVDQFLDMGRSATNVVGNSVATAVVAKWEGALSEKSQLEPEESGAPTTRLEAPDASR